MMLDGAPLPTYASIKDFQHGKAGYVADVVDQALLLPKDMVDLRTMKKHEVFLSLKRDLVLVSILCVCVYIYIYIYILLKVLITFYNHCVVFFTGCVTCAHGRGASE